MDKLSSTTAIQDLIVIRNRATAQFCLGLALVCTITFIAFDLQDLSWATPIDFRGDSLLTLSAIQNMIHHGWYFHTAHLGSPFGQYLQDFPAPADGLFLLTAKGLSQVFSNPANIFNFLVLSAFPLNYCGAVIGLRMMRISSGLAVIGAVMYSTVPYNFSHGPGHAGLLWNFSIPIWIAFLVRQLSTEPVLQEWGNPFRARTRERLSSRNMVWTLLIGAVAAATGFYYLVFFLILATPAAISEVWRGRSVWRSGVALSIVSSLFVFGVQALPIVGFQRTYGRNTATAVRTLSEVAYYGLKPIALITPAHYTRLGFLSNWFDRFGSDSLSAENATSLGILISAVVLLALVGSCVNWRLIDAPLFARLSRLLFFCLIVAVPYGGGYLLGGLGFTQVRVWSRMAIVIAFLGVAIFCELAKQARSRFRAGNRSAVAAFYTLISVLLLLQLLDTVPTTPSTARTEITRQWKSMRHLMNQIDTRIGRNARIFQLPVVPFPENPPVNLMTDYEHLKPYIVDPTKFFSYGGIKGRSLPWSERLSDDPETQIREIRSAGFDALWLDRNGWPSRADPYEPVLTKQFKLKPIAKAERRYVVYDIRSVLVDATIQERSAQLVSPITVEFGHGFWPEETDGSRTWHWAGEYGFIYLKNLARKPTTARVTLEIELRKSGQPKLDTGCRTSQASGPNLFTATCDVQVPKNGRTIRASSNLGPIVDQDPRDLRFRVLSVHTQVVSTDG